MSSFGFRCFSNTRGTMWQHVLLRDLAPNLFKTYTSDSRSYRRYFASPNDTSWFLSVYQGTEHGWSPISCSGNLAPAHPSSQPAQGLGLWWRSSHLPQPTLWQWCVHKSRFPAMFSIFTEPHLLPMLWAVDLELIYADISRPMYITIKIFSSNTVKPFGLGVA